VGRPFFGVVPRVLREDGEPARPGEKGLLFLDGKWPGMMSTVVRDHEWYRRTYFHKSPNLYFTGDSAMIDEKGQIWIMGRIDDVIKVSGHRIGSVEVENALASHHLVSNVAVVPVPHRIKGEGIYCFINLANGTEGSRELEVELIRHLRAKMGPIVTPQRMHFCQELPMTKNGKVVKDILRRVARGELEELGDVTGLSNPSSIKDLILTRP
jgi:acetyl-CoA synthetase